jgi:hypothetical protein
MFSAKKVDDEITINHMDSVEESKESKDDLSSEANSKVNT